MRRETEAALKSCLLIHKGHLSIGLVVPTTVCSSPSVKQEERKHAPTLEKTSDGDGGGDDDNENRDAIVMPTTCPGYKLNKKERFYAPKDPPLPPSFILLMCCASKHLVRTLVARPNRSISEARRCSRLDRRPRISLGLGLGLPARPLIWRRRQRLRPQALLPQHE